MIISESKDRNSKYIFLDIFSELISSKSQMSSLNSQPPRPILANHKKNLQ